MREIAIHDQQWKKLVKETLEAARKETAQLAAKKKAKRKALQMEKEMQRDLAQVELVAGTAPKKRMRQDQDVILSPDKKKAESTGLEDTHGMQLCVPVDQTDQVPPSGAIVLDDEDRKPSTPKPTGREHVNSQRSTRVLRSNTRGKRG
jgi:hypothetical protein